MVQLGTVLVVAIDALDWRLGATVVAFAGLAALAALALGFGVVVVHGRWGNRSAAVASNTAKHDRPAEAWALVIRAVWLCGLGGASILVSAALVGAAVAQLLAGGVASGPRGAGFSVLAVMVGVVGACLIIPWADRAARRASNVLEASWLDVPGDRSVGMGAITRHAA